MVTGVTRNYSTALAEVRSVIDPSPGRVIGMWIVIAGPHGDHRRHQRHEMPVAEELVEIAMEAALRAAHGLRAGSPC